MRCVPLVVGSLLILSGLLGPAARCLAAFDAEGRPDPREERRLQFTKYSRQLLKSYDLAFADDYAGAIREVTAAIEILPDEGLAYAERAKYLRTLNNQKEAERDFRKALTLFDQAIRNYRPHNNGKKTNNNKGVPASVDPVESARMIALIRYQRGEAYFGFEQYRQAGDDFELACRGGSIIACSRLQDLKMIEKRGINWVPLAPLLYYDRQRVVRPSKDVVRVWVRRENAQPGKANAAQVGIIQQQLELKCSSREFRVLETKDPSVSGESGASRFQKPAPGNVAGKLLYVLCPGTDVK